MKNLEIKLRLNQFPSNLTPYFAETLYQTDTYYSCPDGRLKLREEKGKEAYFIFYQRPNTTQQKLSNYEVFPVKDLPVFEKIFGCLLHEEIRIVKQRELFLVENARVHVDEVEGLGMFMEIEVVIKTDEQERNANNLLETILRLTNTENNERVGIGYRELLIQKLDEKKDISYYTEKPKMFWVVNKDLEPGFKANDIVPCLFTEFKDGRHHILQLDLSVKDDGCKYTMWRKMVGQKYGFECRVVLLSDQGIFELSGVKVDPESIGRSQIYIHRSMPARFSGSS